MTDRAVSDVVGYVLVFSLIVATVGVVTTVGFSTLDDRQGAERINNAERAFDVFATNVEDVYREGAPSRATEMRFVDGTLRYGEPVSITIADRDDPQTNVSVFPRPLVYADGGTEIVYVAGSVIRSEQDSAVMLRDPPFYADATAATFPLVDTFRTSGPGATTPDGSLRVTSTARSVDTTTPEAFEEADGYIVTVQSPRSDAWTRYLESHDGFSGVTHDEADDTVEATIEADRVDAPQFLIRLRISE